MQLLKERLKHYTDGRLNVLALFYKLYWWT